MIKSRRSQEDNYLKNIFLMFLTALFFLGCGLREPSLKVGLICGLSGANADLGEAGRNGVMIAVDRINSSGGINGKPIELIVKDDENDFDTAAAAAQSLYNEDVDLVIGAFSTTLTEAIMSVMKDKETLVITPTASALHLSGVDDNLLRINSSSRENGEDYADFMKNKRGYQTTSVLLDSHNLSFTESWFREFERAYSGYGGEITAKVFSDSTESVDYRSIVNQLIEDNPDSLLFVTNTVDSARFAQQIRKESLIPIVISEWAGTLQLIELGGEAVEGVEVKHTFDMFSKEEGYLQFKEEYRNRFGRDPGYSSVLAANAVLVYSEAKKAQGKKQTLKESILQNGPYQGIQQMMLFDEFGDTRRTSSFVRVKDARFIEAP